jgi:hypothetical protein
MVAVAGPLESFYKPELDAAHNGRLEVIEPIALTKVQIPSPGITINRDFQT